MRARAGEGQLEALRSRLQRVAVRARQARDSAPPDSYERGYRAGLAVGYAEAAKRVLRLMRGGR